MKIDVKVLIENLQEEVAPDEALKARMTEALIKCAALEGFESPSEVSVMLVDDDEIREINKEQRGIDKATDVLSFPIVDMHEGTILSDEGDVDMEEGRLLLGDIVISMETMKRQAGEYGHSIERELCFLATHGMFHLLGYDHGDEEEERIMIGKQEQVLASMGLERDEEQKAD